MLLAALFLPDLLCGKDTQQKDKEKQEEDIQE